MDKNKTQSKGTQPAAKPVVETDASKRLEASDERINHIQEKQSRGEVLTPEESNDLKAYEDAKAAGR